MANKIKTIKWEIKNLEDRLKKLREDLKQAEKEQSGRAPCPHCNGKGEIRDGGPMGSGWMVPCHKCKGSGFWNGEWPK